LFIEDNLLLELDLHQLLRILGEKMRLELVIVGIFPLKIVANNVTHTGVSIPLHSKETFPDNYTCFFGSSQVRTWVEEGATVSRGELKWASVHHIFMQPHLTLHRRRKIGTVQSTAQPSRANDYEKNISFAKWEGSNRKNVGGTLKSMDRCLPKREIQRYILIEILSLHHFYSNDWLFSETITSNWMIPQYSKCTFR
jgi:hypothetical protein